MSERDVKLRERPAERSDLPAGEPPLEMQFLQPSDEFTPVPFWFWNDNVTEDELLRQIGDFADKGVMGFVIHPRMGMPKTIRYMSDRYLELVEAAVREADRRGMIVFLYDEAMYPSGSANGLVVRGHPELASRGLRMVELAAGEPVELASVLEPGDVLVSAQAIRKRDGRLHDADGTAILRPESGVIAFDPPGGAEDWTIALFIESYSKGTIRGIHEGEDDGEPNAPASADLLNPEATRRFIRLTHERYYERLGRYFGTTIRAIFTDEPEILGRRHRKGMMPWTAGFLRDFTAAGCGETELPLLWLEGPGASDVRRRYRRAVRARLAASYYAPLADWCERHGVALTGHPAGSEDIGLLDHFHIPGQDVVWRWVAPEDGKALTGRHSTMAKCSSDAARHRGRRRNLNEFLGVCGPGNGWALTADDMKWYIDWLTVRGVNWLCPHAFYYSVDGPIRYNERPPDVGPNNIWWPHYRRFADYMKRMSWLMTDGVGAAEVAVLCRDDRLPWAIVKPLYERQIEFNYLEEQLLATACEVGDGAIRIAGYTYRALLVEADGDAWERQAVDAMRRFHESGGAVIVLDENGVAAGELPFAARIAEAGRAVEALVGRERPEHAAAQPGGERREAPAGRIRQDVRLEPPCPDIRVSHRIKAGQHFYVLVNEGERHYEGTALLSAIGRAERWDAWNGEIGPASARFDAARKALSVAVRLERRQSVVFRIDPGAPPAKKSGLRGEPDSPPTAPADAPVDSDAFSPETMPVPGSAETVDEIRLTDCWRVEAPHFESAPPGLGSWTECPGLERESGTVTYYNRFAWNDAQQPGATASPARIWLDLGDVGEIAEVRVNGQLAGVAMWRPYRLDIGSFVRPGDNELAITVANSLANRYDGAGLPSGLIGPVRIVKLRNQ